MRNKFKLIALILLVILGGLCISPVSVSADREQAEAGDKIWFAGREWIILDMNSTRWLLYASTNSSYGLWNAYWNGYLGSAQDSHFVSLQNVMNANYNAEYNMIIEKSLKNQWYEYTTWRETGTAQGRKVYGLLDSDFCKYMYGRPYGDAVNSGNSVTCGTDGKPTLTRVGHLADRGANNRPIYFDSYTSISGVSCNGFSTSTTWTLRGATNSSGGSVNYFAIPSNTKTQFTVAGSTPGGTYTLDIEQKYSVTNGSLSAVSKSSGCYSYPEGGNPNSAVIRWNYRPEIEVDATKITGIVWDTGNSRWKVQGNNFPTVANSQQAGTFDYKTTQQTGTFVGSRRNKTITYTVTINGLPNPLQFANSSGTVKFSNSAQTTTFNAATNGQGAVTYQILSAKNAADNAVNYFSLANASQNKITVAAGTPVGTYTIELKAKAAGNVDYLEGNKTATYTLTVTKAANPAVVAEENQRGSVVYSLSDQTKVFDGATGGQGGITYSISNQTDADGNPVNYFSIANSGSAAFTVAGGTPAGDYIITIPIKIAGNASYEEKTITLTYILTVNKANIVPTAPTARTITYNGNPQTLINAGSTPAGTIQYKLGSDGGWGTTLPQETAAGTYDVYYRVVGNSNYNDYPETGPVKVTIKKAKLTPTAPDQVYTYNGQKQGVAVSVVGVATDPITIKYGTVNGTYGSNSPNQITNVSESGTFYYQASAPNHETITGSYKITINPRDINLATVDGIPTQDYEGTPLNPTITARDLGKTLSNPNDFTQESSNNTLAAETDSGTGKVTITGHGNYTGTKEVSFSIKAKEYTISFKGNGATGGVPGNIIKKYGCTLQLPELTPKRETYTFLGYGPTSNNAAGEQWQPGDNFTENSEMTLYAHWKYVLTRYEETYFHISPDTRNDTPDTLKYFDGYKTEKSDTTGKTIGMESHTYCYYYHPDLTSCIVTLNNVCENAYPDGVPAPKAED